MTRGTIKKLQIRLFHRKEVWTLTIWGWGVTLFCLSFLAVFAFSNIYPFLAVNSPLAADVLVVEGWMPDSVLETALAEFRRGQYRKLIATGLPLRLGYHLSEYKSFAELAAATLIALGLEKEYVVAVPAPNSLQNRTYTAAVALKEWLLNSDLKVRAINLYTLGPHTRRSWFIFKKVLAPEISVGAIAAEPIDYNSQNWWKSSEGVRTVIFETIAYIYARLINWKS
ncbi:MAG: YdcF family protein [Oscillatoriaceae bacterium SKW80]|nr:YdcF family protein [Oscillatoriaceae bacterium SKYG93]MCX8119508.1 YdcF family protein [Oscillatoriaceae bacterium SKW80]MDW8454975.1 ElyC/SanA/YdcF family protein [Oscillatoriaceae cyanobacterium SKYGB_i_bin93]